MQTYWTPTLLTGVTFVDKDHQEIFHQADLLLQAMKEGKGHGELKQIIDFVDNYIISHFAREEQYMEEHNYPMKAVNKAAHAQFIKKFRDIKAMYESSTASSALVLSTLTDWFKEHIQKIDSNLKHDSSNAPQEPALSR
jgi:hemerythrin